MKRKCVFLLIVVLLLNIPVSVFSDCSSSPSCDAEEDCCVAGCLGGNCIGFTSDGVNTWQCICDDSYCCPPGEECDDSSFDSMVCVATCDPNAFDYCDSGCGTCGWKDECGGCHNGAKPNGGWCCHRQCKGSTGECGTVFGAGSNLCDNDDQCCVQDTIDYVNCRKCKTDGTWGPNCANYGPLDNTDACNCEFECNVPDQSYTSACGEQKAWCPPGTWCDTTWTTGTANEDTGCTETQTISTASDSRYLACNGKRRFRGTYLTCVFDLDCALSCYDECDDRGYMQSVCSDTEYDVGDCTVGTRCITGIEDVSWTECTNYCYCYDYVPCGSSYPECQSRCSLSGCSATTTTTTTLPGTTTTTQPPATTTTTPPPGATTTTTVACSYNCWDQCMDDTTGPDCFDRISHGTNGCTGGLICCQSRRACCGTNICCGSLFWERCPSEGGNCDDCTTK